MVFVIYKKICKPGGSTDILITTDKLEKQMIDKWFNDSERKLNIADYKRSQMRDCAINISLEMVPLYSLNIYQ